MKPVYITDIAVSLPNAAVSNNDIETVLGQVGNKPSRARRIVLKSNGIKSRYYAINPETGEPTHTNASLTAEAIHSLQDTNLDDVDCLTCGTSMPDQLMPNHAVMVHGELANPSCEVVATAGVCLAGMTAMKYAWMGVAAGEHENSIATGSELASASLRASFFESEVEAKVEALEKSLEIAFEKDFLRWMLSDGAGAVRMQPQPAASGLSLKVEWIDIRSYANEQDACMYSGAEKNSDGSLSSWKTTSPKKWLSESTFSVKQDVKQLNENIVEYTVEKPLTEVIKKRNLKSEDIDFFLPHYSSTFFRQKLADGLENVGLPIPFDRWVTNLTSKGNTGSASIYIMMDELFRSGRLQKGHKVLCYVPESGRFSSAFMLLTVCDHQG